MKPQRSDPAFRRYLERGLEQLRASRGREARYTLAALTSGRVKVDAFSDLTARDFRHLRRDLAAQKLRPDDYRRLHDPRSRALRAISGAINGYMWDDRVYVHRQLSPKKLASTLVHEVTHVLNRSEERYRTPRSILLEEYRSFYAEKRFLGVEMTAARCRALKAWVIREYGLSGVTPADVPDLPPSRAR